MRNGAQHLYAPTLALVEDVTWMAQTGETQTGAARRLGVRPKSLARSLSRAGRPDLWARLGSNSELGHLPQGRYHGRADGWAA